MDIAALHQGYSSNIYSTHYQLEALKQQNSKYQQELSVSKEQSSSESQRISILCKEIECRALPLLRDFQKAVNISKPSMFHHRQRLKLQKDKTNQLCCAPFSLPVIF
ncbi:hypothetical protein ILYODFUR_019996 [Ilyodon furcidens]|uniref:Uncharacterized protein n=1 Tax=Ilyodon furcidens TaxID=33524 RepID=A0ABV0UKP8_9TELE